MYEIVKKVKKHIELSWDGDKRRKRELEQEGYKGV